MDTPLIDQTRNGAHAHMHSRMGDKNDQLLLDFVCLGLVVHDAIVIIMSHFSVYMCSQLSGTHLS